MLLRKHYLKMLYEFSMFFGGIVFLLLTYGQLSGEAVVKLNVLWAMVLLVLALGFRLESLVNFHKLDEHEMRLNYLISSVLADVSLILLLYYFTPGGKQFEGRGWMIISVYAVLKGGFYLAMHIQSVFSARKINAALRKTHIQ